MFGFWRNYWLRWQMRREASLTRRSPFWGRLLYPCFWLVMLPGIAVQGALLSLRNWIDTLAQGRRTSTDLLLGLPAIVLMLLFAGVTAMGHRNQSTAGQRYWASGERELRRGEHRTAQIFLQKALLSERVNRRDIVFALAHSYEMTGATERADALMANLAAVGTAGYPAAHRYLAIRTAEVAAKTHRIDDLQAWHWHLSHAGQPHSPSLAKAWGMYYLVCGELESSIKHFRIAAEEQPALWLQVAELEARVNDLDAVHRTLATARNRLEQQFISDRGSSSSRLLYATSLIHLGELPAAEKLLKEGLLAEDNASFRQLLAAVFVRMHDASVGSPEGMGKGFRFLRMSLEHDPNHHPALTRLVSFARSTPERLDDSRALMRQLISSGDSSAMAHFTLGTLEWIAGNMELAKLNMSQAVALDPQMPVVANNMAYLLARTDEGQLEAALSLVNQAVETAPGNADFLDTRAIIYEKLGRDAEAAVDYQRALAAVADPKPFQQKLAELYERLGDVQLAARYRHAAEGVEALPPTE